MGFDMSVYSQFNTMPTNPRAVQVITSTQNWSPPASGWVNFVAIGAGGGGTGGYNLYDYGGVVSSSSTGRGGAAGGVAIKSIYVTKGQSYTITIGAGGAGATNGNNATTGGATTIVGPGISLTVTGGAGANKNVASVGGTVVNTANATYDFYAQGGGANNYGGGAVSLYGNTAFATSNSSQGAGTGSPSGYGFPAALGPNATPKIPAVSSEGGLVPAAATAAQSAANSGGAGMSNYVSSNTYLVVQASGSGAFAGGTQAYAEGYLYNYGAVSVSRGGVAGTGAGGGGPYSFTATDYANTNAYALAEGSAGGAGCVIVEIL